MRRSFLALAATFGLVVLAGCSQTNTQGTATPGPGGREAMDKDKRSPEGVDGQPRTAPIDDGGKK